MELDIYEEKHPWGGFRQFTHNENTTVKILTVLKDEAFSLQSHTKRSEFWKVIKGSGIIEIDGIKFVAREGDEFNIKIGEKHRIYGGDTDVSVLEISTGEFDEGDIVRYEDKYGRV